MKSLVKSVLAVVAVGFLATSASAVNSVATQMTVASDTVTKDTTKKEVPLMTYQLAQNEVTYTKIEVSEVTEVVKQAAAKKYEGYTIEEAYKGSDKTVKLVLKSGDTSVTAIYTEEGELVEKPAESVPTTLLLG